MYTLYDMVFDDSEKSIRVFTSLQEAEQYRDSFAQATKADPSMFRLIPVDAREYWVCEGNVYYDYVLLRRDYGGMDKPVSYYTSMRFLDPVAVSRAGYAGAGMNSAG